MTQLNTFDLQTQSLFTRWAGMYDSWLFRIYFERLYRRIMSFVQPDSSSYVVPGANVLDVACGTGEIITRLARLYPATKFIGLDVTPAMVEKARRKTKALPNVEFREGNAASLPLPDEMFDVVLCSEAFHHFAKPDRAAQEMYRVMKDGGRLYLVDPGFSSSALTRIVEIISHTFEVNKHVYSQIELRQLLQKVGFLIVSVSHAGLNNFFICTKRQPALYECPECHFRYRDKGWADKCQAWCREHKSCNLEIISHAIENSTD